MSALSAKQTYRDSFCLIVIYAFHLFQIKTFKNQKYAALTLNLNLSYFYLRVQICVGISKGPGELIFKGSFAWEGGAQIRRKTCVEIWGEGLARSLRIIQLCQSDGNWGLKVKSERVIWKLSKTRGALYTGDSCYKQGQKGMEEKCFFISASSKCIAWAISILTLTLWSALSKWEWVVLSWWMGYRGRNIS